MNRTLSTSILLLLVIIAQIAHGQTVTISADVNEICIPQNGTFTVTLTADLDNPPSDPFEYRWFRRGNLFATTNSATPTTSYTYNNTDPYNNPQDYYVRVITTPNTPAATSSTLNIPLHRYANGITEANPPGTEIVMNTTDAPQALLPMLNNVPSWADVVFTGSGVEVSSGNYQFNPMLSPSSYQVQYSVSHDGFCPVASQTLSNTVFRVVDGEAPMPGFIKNYDPLPICEGQTSFTLLASINPTCFLMPNNPPDDISIYVGHSPSGEIVTGTRYGTDIFSGNPRYKFTINPSLHYSNFYYLYVYITTPLCSQYAGYIPLEPRRTPFLVGLPSPNPISGNEVYLCSASSDTISMRGNPSGGTYNYYLGDPAGAGYTYTKITGSISPFTPPAEDISLQKFLPAAIFNDFANADINNVIKVVYTRPGTCPDSVTRILKFIPPIPVSFTKPASTPYCFGDSLHLKVDYGSVTPNPGDKFSWDFGDRFLTGFVPDTNVSRYYAAPGHYAVRFRTKINGMDPTLFCNNDIIDSIRIGATPTVDFEVFKNFKDTAALFHSSAAIDVPSISDVAGAWIP